jgi:glycosyltransferase involved in cell wall biosynthesis
MRILHIVGTISPAAGGPTEVIRMLVQHAPPGFTSEVATLDDPASPFLADLPFKVHACGSAKKSWYVPAFLRWMRSNRDRFDGVIVHGLWEFTGVAALLALRNRVPYAVFPHGMLDPWFKRRYPAKHAKKWIYWLLAEYWVLRHAFRVLFTTHAESTLAKQSFWLHQWKPQIVPIGCEGPPAGREALLETFHNRWPQLKDKRFLLFLGRIDPKKAPDLLLRAFADQTVVQHDPNLCLMMAGPSDPAYRSQLEAQNFSFHTEMRIHWPGMLQGHAKWGALAAAEAFILPSHQENFGVAVVEALASGTPVLLAHPVNISPEIAADGCGFVEPDTLEGTRNLLNRWLATTAAEREAMSTQARLTFAARYDMRRNAEAILRIFDNIPHPKQATSLQEAN